MDQAAQMKAEARQALSALSGQIEPVGLTWTYKAGLALVALAMLLLPLIYAGSIALLGFGVYEYAIHAGGVLFANSTTSGGRGWVLRVMIYVTPLMGGVVAMVFMVKPFFAPRAAQRVPLTVEPGEQADLHLFIEKLCAAVGAPEPARIDVDCRVNASASFRRGLRSFLGGDVVLTIGLPLVAGMSLRQFSGVLAHELGHFTQSGAMRLTYLIRWVSHWFTRVVYERDSWDQSLENTAANSEHGLVLLVVHFIRLMVYLSRRVLWVLMMIGHAVSGLMLRQMEYDADRFEAQISGSAGFADTFNRLSQLNVGSDLAFKEVRQGWLERRLGDNLPSMIANHAEALSPEARVALHRHMLEQKTGWFASHPAMAQRIASAEAEAARGLIQTNVPARVLFGNFENLCRLATAHHYQTLLGAAYETVTLVPVQRMMDENKKNDQADAAIAEYFGFEPPVGQPIFPDYTARRPSNNQSDDVDRLFAAKNRLAAAKPEFAARLEAIREASARQAQLQTLADLRRGELQFNPADFAVEAATGNAILAARTQADQKRQSADQAFGMIADAAQKQLSLALRLYHAAVVNRHPQAEQQLDRLLNAADALGASVPLVDEIWLNQVSLETMFKQLREAQQQPALVQQVHKRAEYLGKLIARVREPLNDVVYPFEHGQGDIVLANHLIPVVLPPGQVVMVLEVTGVALERWAIVSRRVQAALIDLANRAEAAAEKMISRRELEILED